MLKAGTAKLCSFATSKIALPVVSIAALLLLAGWGCCSGERDVSGLDGAGREAADEPSLEDEEQDEHRDGSQDAHGHNLVPLVRMLSHQELDTDGNGSHVVGTSESQREQVFVP